MKMYQCHTKAHVEGHPKCDTEGHPKCDTEGHPKCDPKGQTFSQLTSSIGAGLSH
jgi:hypothetical protein